MDLQELTNQIIAYEAGELTEERIVVLFSHLIRSGLVWELQGHYGREAENLIRSGLLDLNGNILGEHEPNTDVADSD